MFELAHTLNRQFAIDSGVYKGLNLYSFADNHDVSRVASVLRDKQQLKPLYGLLFTLPGVPSIYYGSEWGAQGRREDGDVNVRPDVADWQDNDLSRHISWWAKYRRDSDVLAHGDYRELAAGKELLVFRRELGGRYLDFAVNIAKSKESRSKSSLKIVSLLMVLTGSSPLPSLISLIISISFSMLSSLKLFYNSEICPLKI